MLKKILKILGLLFILLVFVIFTCNIIISNTADGKTFTDISSTPKNRVGLVLGTSNKLTNGSPNPYYTYRINATKALYNAGKIEFILVSGDNGSIYYNEPDTFKKDLIKAGIPERAIFLDYAGFRTLDSMFRA